MQYEKMFEAYPYLESEDLVLKKIEHEDLKDFYDLMSDEVLFKFKPGKAKKNEKSVDNMIDHYQRDFLKKKMIFLGIYLKSEDKLIGLGEVFDIDKKTSQVTFGYTLNRAYWGRGYATQYSKCLMDYLFNTIGINRLQAFVMPENIKSLEVLRRCHFTEEGTIRQGHFWKDKGAVDLTVFSVLKSDL